MYYRQTKDLSLSILHLQQNDTTKSNHSEQSILILTENSAATAAGPLVIPIPTRLP